MIGLHLTYTTLYIEQRQFWRSRRTLSLVSQQVLQSRSSKLALLLLSVTDNFQYQSPFLCMRVTNWPNICVDQCQFSDQDFISATYQRENVQFVDITEILLRLVLNTNQSYLTYSTDDTSHTDFMWLWVDV